MRKWGTGHDTREGSSHLDDYLTSLKMGQSSFKPHFRFKGFPLRTGLLLLALSLTIGGVAASVAMTLYGNSSTTPNQVSLGVGQAAANSCETTGDQLYTDTVGKYDDTQTAFVLEQINVHGLDPNCAGKALTLVIHPTSGNDATLTCTLPATSAVSPTSYSQATFIFATSANATAASGQYVCSSAGNTIYYPYLLASVANSAVSIQ
jgi:hypothetical protein